MHTHACRCGIAVLVAVMGTSWLAVPARADTSPPVQRSALTIVPAKTLETLRQQAPKARAQQAGTTAEPRFLKSKKGAIAVSLMAAGAAFTVWSINHDREPVKSPIR